MRRSAPTLLRPTARQSARLAGALIGAEATPVVRFPAQDDAREAAHMIAVAAMRQRRVALCTFVHKAARRNAVTLPVK